MIRVSELLSKRLIALSTAEIIGTVSNIIFDEKLTKGLILKIYNDDGDDVSISYADLKKVKSFEEDACTVKDKSAIMYEWNSSIPPFNNPINCECYNQDGKVLGIVKDLILEENKVQSIIVGNTEFKPGELLSYSDQLLIINDTGKPYKLPKNKIKIPKSDAPLNRKIVVHSLSENQPATGVKTFDSADKTEKPEEVKTDIALPHKMPPLGQVSPMPAENAQTPYSFLLGKTVSKDIFSDNGIIIIEDKSLVTSQIILAAKKAGKLVQLALHAE